MDSIGGFNIILCVKWDVYLVHYTKLLHILVVIMLHDCTQCRIISLFITHSYLRYIYIYIYIYTHTHTLTCEQFLFHDQSIFSTVSHDKDKKPSLNYATETNTHNDHCNYMPVINTGLCLETVHAIRFSENLYFDNYTMYTVMMIWPH
jgi:hypothetical protein